MADYSFSCDRRALARALRRADRVVGSGARVLDIGGAWLTVDEAILTVAVTRPPVTLVERVPVDGRGEGALVVPLLPLRAVVLSRRSGEAIFEGTGRKLRFRSGAFHAELDAIAPESVIEPLAPTVPVQTATLSGTSLRAGLDHVALSVGHRYGWRPGQAGLELTVRSGSLRLAATDLVTLAIAEHRDPSAQIPFDQPVVLPPEALDALGRHLLVRHRAEVRLGSDQADFVTRDTTIRSELPLQDFPDYEPIRSTRATRRCRVDRRQLLPVVERVAALSRGDSPARVWLDLRADTITARTLDRQVGSASDSCPAQLDGDPCTVGTYLWTLVACLRQLKGDDLVAEIGDPRKRMSIWSSAYPDRRYHLLPLALDPPIR